MTNTPPRPAGQARTIVVTGGSGGLGLGCATALARSADGPWHVILASRDPQRTREAAEKLSGTAHPGNSVEAMPLDLASLASVRAFAAELRDRLTAGAVPPPRAVVCNAGVQAGTRLTWTADGFESTFGVNHLGHFLLVHELLPALRSPARVVVVASGVHDPAQHAGVPVPAWNAPKALARGELGPEGASDNAFVAGQRRYSTSKLANVYFTFALARRLPDGVTANAYDPGMVLGTGLQRSAPAPLRFAARHLLPHVKPLVRRFITDKVYSAQESGAALAWLATAPELAGTSGRYYHVRQALRASEAAYDVDRADELWEASLRLTAQPAGR